MQEWQTETHEAIYHAGHLVITNKVENKCSIVRLHDMKGRDITLTQFRDGIKTSGLEKTMRAFSRLVANWQ